MTRHLKLIVEGATDYALGVYDVGDSGRTESESAAHIVKTADFSRGVASEFIRNSNGVAEPLIPICAVCTYANYYRIKRHQLIMGFAETPDLDFSSVSERPNEEEEDDIPASTLREGELLSRTERESEVWGFRTYLEHRPISLLLIQVSATMPFWLPTGRIR